MYFVAILTKVSKYERDSWHVLNTFSCHEVLFPYVNGFKMKIKIPILYKLAVPKYLFFALIAIGNYFVCQIKQKLQIYKIFTSKCCLQFQLG